MIKVIFVLSDFSGILYFPARMDDLLKHKMTAVYAIFVYMLLIVTHEYVYFLYRFFVQLSRTIFFYIIRIYIKGALSSEDRRKFKVLLKTNGVYKLRAPSRLTLPSNVPSPVDESEDPNDDATRWV